MKRISKVIAIIFIILFLVYCFLCWQLSNRILFPQSSHESTVQGIAEYWNTTFDEIIAPLPTPEDFAITSQDGLTIKGKYFKNSDTATCGILMAHGWGSNWAGMLKYAAMFDSCDCDIVLYDHRNHGDSDKKYATAGIKEKLDLVAVNDWFMKKTKLTNSQIAWVGSSWGASTALQASVLENQQPAFIIADAPYQDWYSAIFERALRDYGNTIKVFEPMVLFMVNQRAGVNYKEASTINIASQIEVPVLLTHSSTDPSTAYQQSVNIAQHLNPDNHTFHIMEWGGGHTLDVIINPEKYKILVRDFMTTYSPDFTTCDF